MRIVPVPWARGRTIKVSGVFMPHTSLPRAGRGWGCWAVGLRGKQITPLLEKVFFIVSLLDCFDVFDERKKY